MNQKGRPVNARFAVHSPFTFGTPSVCLRGCFVRHFALLHVGGDLRSALERDAWSRSLLEGMHPVDFLLATVVALFALALIFDFTNGFHDAANSVATVVATRALPAKWAPAFAAFFNFLAYFVVGTAVASTIAKTVKSGVRGRGGRSRRSSRPWRGTSSRGTWACRPHQVTRSSVVSSVPALRLREALRPFRGAVWRRPPSVSWRLPP